MAENITISSANNIGLYNNSYQYNFKNGSTEFDDDTYITSNQIILPNSIANISPALNNNRFAYSLLGNAYEGGTGSSPIAFTLNTSVSNSNVISLNITYGFLWIGYAIFFNNLTTSNPIYITNISLADVNSATASITINQNITLSAGATGSARMVGNQIIIQTIYGAPKPNMLLDENGTRNSLGFLTLDSTNIYYLSVLPQNQANTNNIFLITISQSIPYEADLSWIDILTFGDYIYPVILETGYYNMEDINLELQKTMFSNGHYIIKDPTDGTHSHTHHPYFRNHISSTNLIFPITISTNYKKYGFSLSLPFLPSNVVTSYGSLAYVNSNYVVNWDFNDIILNNNSAVEPVNINGWNKITSNGGRIVLQRGATLLASVIPGFAVIISPPPNTDFTQFIILTSTISSSSVAKIEVTNSIDLIAGSYTLYYYARKTSTGALDTLTITLDTNYSTNAISGSTWARYSQSFTLAVDTAIPLAFQYTTTNPTQPIGLCLTGIQIINNQSPINNPVMWQNRYIGTSYPSISFGSFQTPTSYSIGSLGQYSFEYSNKYSLQQYYNSSSFLSFMNIYNIDENNTPPPRYGLSMNPFYGALIRCNLAENPMTAVSDIIDAFPMLYPFGSNNIYTGDSRNDIKIKKGRYNNITFTLVAQDGTPLILLDNNVLMNFIINKRKKHV